MLTHVIQQFLEMKPFMPFTLSLTSRTIIRIDRPEQACVSNSGEVLNVLHDDGVKSMISIRHVVCLTTDPPPDEPTVR
jgi:hypothetical protein